MYNSLASDVLNMLQTIPHVLFSIRYKPDLFPRPPFHSPAPHTHPPPSTVNWHCLTCRACVIFLHMEWPIQLIVRQGAAHPVSQWGQRPGRKHSSGANHCHTCLVATTVAPQIPHCGSDRPLCSKWIVISHAKLTRTQTSEPLHLLTSWDSVMITCGLVCSWQHQLHHCMQLFGKGTMGSLCPVKKTVSIFTPFKQ